MNAAAPCLLAGIVLLSSAHAQNSRCLTRTYDTLRMQALERAGLLPLGRFSSPSREPPDSIDIGVEWLWYIWDLSGYPQADLLPCTVRGIGEYCYVVVENSQWNVTVNQQDVDIIVERFNESSPGDMPDKGIYEINTLAFGEPPDALDDDPRIYLLYYDFGISADGFFWIFDQYPDGTQPFHSNECEVVYLNSGAADPGGDYLLAVAAHEFEHMIHFNHDPNEVAWVDEGCAELAMYLYGHPDIVSSFPTNPDNDLTNWSGAWADYIKTYLWTLYFFEHYGGLASVFEVVHEPANSIAGYDSVLTHGNYEKDFASVFLDWVAANFLDDEVFDAGLYGYQGEDLPSFAHVVHEQYPVGPVNTWVNHWAADYVLFRNGTFLSFDFDGSDNNAFALRILKVNTGTTIDVGAWLPGQGQAGSFDLLDFGTQYEDAVMVITSISTTGSSGYEYAATAAAPTIPPVTDLACVAVEDDIVLTWSPRPGASGYALYIAQDAYFMPDQIIPVWVEETTYTQENAVGSDAAWFSVVRGQNGLIQSVDSNRVGALSGGYSVP